MSIVFKCPHCKKLLEAKDELAGRKGACPDCGQTVTVPDTPAGEIPAQTEDISEEQRR